MSEKKENLKRKLLAAADGLSQPFIALIASFLLGAVIIVFCGESVTKVYGALLRGAFGNSFYITETLKQATPILMGGLAVCIAWRSGYEAMGGEGQMIFGALSAALVACYLPGPGIVKILVAILAAAAAGALFSMLSGWLYEKFEVTFIISTLMLNYIANYLASYFTNYVFQDPYGYDTAIQTEKIAVEARLPLIGGVHLGFYLTLVIVVLVFILFNKTSFGYKTRMTGLNSRFALYGGINAKRTLYLVLILSGVMAGLGGAFEVLGSKYRYIDQMIFSTGYAWTGMVAALLANMNPIGTAFASILLAGLNSGSSAIQRDTALSAQVCYVIQGIIMLLMSVRLVRIAQKSKKARLNKGGVKQ